jgi:hypothetical protein
MMLRNTPATVVAMIILMIMPESSVESVVSLTESLKIRKNYSYFHQQTQNVKTTKLTRNYILTIHICVWVPFRPFGPHQCSADEQDESNSYVQSPLMPHECGTSNHARTLKLQAVSVLKCYVS